MKMEWIESTETSAQKAQTPGDYPQKTQYDVQLPPLDFGPPVEKYCNSINMHSNTGLVAASFFFFNTCLYVRTY